MAGEETARSGPSVFHVAIPSVIRRLAGLKPFRRSFAERLRGSATPRCLFGAGMALFLLVTLWHAAVGRVESVGKLDAAYTASLFGFPIGYIFWSIEFRNDRFSASANGETAGLLQIFSPGQGIAKSEGALSAQRPVPSNFMVRFSHGGDSDQIKILFTGGKAKEFLDHPPKPDPNVVPLTDAARTGVIDPMTALIVPVPGKGDTATPAACEHKIPVFDGHMRYDLQLAYKRVEQVSAEVGYRGPAVVCAIYFTPLAGYESRSSIKYLQAQRGMEMWLAPLAGTRLMVPFRVSVPTPIGVGVLQATRFIWIRQQGGSGAPTAD